MFRTACPGACLAHAGPAGVQVVQLVPQSHIHVTGVDMMWRRHIIWDTLMSISTPSYDISERCDLRRSNISVKV